MAPLPNLTDSGLAGIRQVPYGMHACHFYANKEELAQALVPYFVAGLRAHERCLWVTAPPLPALEARRALESAWDGVAEAVERGAIRIIDHDQWYSSVAGLKGVDVIQLWLEEEERALAEGYSGLRTTGNVSFLRPEDWPAFMEYERAVTQRFHGRRIVALCSYALSDSSAEQVTEVMRAHNCAFERPDANWQVLSAR